MAQALFRRLTSITFETRSPRRTTPPSPPVQGYLVGVGFALCGALFGASGVWQEDLIAVSVGGLASVVLMPVSMALCDRLILGRFSVHEEISRDHNVGVGYVVGGVAVATGLSIQGAMTGHSDSLALMARDILVYWACGQTLLIIGGQLFQWLTPFDVHERLEHDDNAAIGLAFAGFLVGQGLMVRAALHGASSALTEELLVIAVWGGLGLVVLSAVALLLSRLLLPGVAVADELVRDRNVGVGAVLAASFVLAAALTVAAGHPTPSQTARRIQPKPTRATLKRSRRRQSASAPPSDASARPWR